MPADGLTTEGYQRSVRRVLVGILLLNLLVTGFKFAAAALTGSIAVLADAFNALVDASSNVIGLLGLHAASEPPDLDHPYGHRKYETIATLAIGGLMVLAGWEVLQDVFRRFGGSRPPTVTIDALILILITLPVNAFIVWFEERRGRALGSDILMADAASTRVNIFVSLAALAGLVGATIGVAWLDIVVALGIVAYVFRSAYRILRETSEVLTDSAAVDPHVVEEIARAVPGVWFATEVRSRGRADDVHLDLRVKVDPAMATEQAHAIASEVERQLREQVPGLVDAVVQIEPGATGPLSEWDAIAVRLRALADGLGLGVHNIHIDVLEGRYLVDVDVEVASTLSLAESHARVSELERRAHRELPQVLDIVTHIEPTIPGDHPLRVSGAEGSRLEERIVALADGVAGAGASHHIVLRHSHAPGRIDVSLHCHARGDAPLIDAHLLAERVERDLRTDLPQLDHITIHVEPAGSLDH